MGRIDDQRKTGPDPAPAGTGSWRGGDFSSAHRGGGAAGGQFARFVLVGAAATAVHYALLIGLVEAAGARPVPATVLGSIAGALVGYAGNRQFTFKSGVPHMRGLPRFLLVALAGLVLNAGIMALLSGPLGIHYLLAQVVATGIVLVWNFAANRHWTFGDPSRG
jgi:putative flippase GtrA